MTLSKPLSFYEPYFFSFKNSDEGVKKIQWGYECKLIWKLHPMQCMIVFLIDKKFS